MEDFFQCVSSQLNQELSFIDSTSNYHNQSAQISSNFYFDQSITYFHEPTREKSKLSRKQSTVKDKKSKNIIQDLQVSQFQPICLRQIAFNGDLDKQLLRLEKTLQTESKPKKAIISKKRKAFIKRLERDKQNNDQYSRGKNNQAISSQQLQQIKNIDEDLYNVCIELLRFYDNQKEHQQKLVSEIQINKIQLLDKNKELNSLKIQLRNKVAQGQQQEKKESRLDYLQFRKLYESYSNAQIDFTI